MNESRFRLTSGGRIDRTKPLVFSFDGRRMTGYAGDTLASALIANGVRLVGRSFKYHRPRGILGIGAEEPNALVTIRAGGQPFPNARATMVPLHDRLEATSQHAWPTLAFDIGAVNGLLAPFIPAGFYYKTFMGPVRGAWMFYEALIRRAAGLGRASRDPDPSRYEKTHAHAEVVVIGAGPAGMAAALAAANGGARVILIDEAAEPGGWLLRERNPQAVEDWHAATLAALRAHAGVTMLSRTTAFGLYDGLQVAAAEETAEEVLRANPFAPRARLWLIRAKRIVLACGAIEQPLLFEGNDRPGVMLAGAARGYANQYAALPGRRAVILATDDSAYRTAADLAANGAEVAAILDLRDAPGKAARDASAPVLTASSIRRVIASAGQVRAVEIGTGNGMRRIDCDLIAMSGGWAPAVHLSTHLGGKPAYDAVSGLFLPAPALPEILCAGAMCGLIDTEDCIADGERCGHAAAAGQPAEKALPVARAFRAMSNVSGSPKKSFIDFQNDVTAADVELAHREGYRSVEHLKRYTTLGMGNDQGKTANIAGLTMMAALTQRSPAETGTTTFRPPYTPVSIGALAGLERGRHLRPVRRTPMHDWHEANGALMAETGVWMRPKAYLRPGEDVLAAQIREARAVRAGVGIVDVSTLGKIEVAGPDATAFLDRIYASPVKTLKVGRARYAIMLREDGIVLDDGTLTRLARDRYYITTTTAQAARVLAHMEQHAAVTWPEMEVHCISVSDRFGAIAVAGPQSRALLAKLTDPAHVGDDVLPHAGFTTLEIGGVPVYVFRMSYSGERAYELHIPADYALSLWERLIALGATPYGTEAMAILRIEKGHVAGAEIDGRTTPHDLGLTKLLKREGDYIGKRMLERPALADPARPSLAGLVPVDGRSRLRGGAQITLERDPPRPARMIGYTTSACFSPALESPITLALIERAAERMGETVYVQDPVRGLTVAARIVNPVFYDTEGTRLHA